VNSSLIQRLFKSFWSKRQRLYKHWKR